jgi:hypothetical protein
MVQEGYPEQKLSLLIEEEKDCKLTPEKQVYNKKHSAKRILV